MQESEIEREVGRYENTDVRYKRNIGVLLFFVKRQPLGTISIQIKPVPILILNIAVFYLVPAPKLVP